MHPEIPSELHLEIHFEISPEMNLQMHFEIFSELNVEAYPNNDIYGRSIPAKTRKQTARRNRNSIILAKPHPQPPCRALAWSYR